MLGSVSHASTPRPLDHSHRHRHRRRPGVGYSAGDDLSICDETFGVCPGLIQARFSLGPLTEPTSAPTRDLPRRKAHLKPPQVLVGF